MAVSFKPPPHAVDTRPAKRTAAACLIMGARIPKFDRLSRMRFVRFLCACGLFACGTSSSQDAGVDAAVSDASADAGTTADVVITDPQCVEAGASCQACCSTVHPDASGIFDTMIAACSCGDA